MADDSTRCRTARSRCWRAAVLNPSGLSTGRRDLARCRGCHASRWLTNQGAAVLVREDVRDEASKRVAAVWCGRGVLVVRLERTRTPRNRQLAHVAESMQ